MSAKIILMNLRKTNLKKLLLIGVILLVIALMMLTGLIVSNKQQPKKMGNANKAIQAKTTTGIVGASKFTEAVYKQRLENWNVSEREFITEHKIWFTESFQKQNQSAIDPGSALFCTKLKEKPEQFEIGATNTSPDGATSTVYVQAKGKAGLNNVLTTIQLKKTGQYWAINARYCSEL